MLPMKTSSEDVEQMINYLKTKPKGASVADAKKILTGKLVDGRKLSAYSFWGFVENDGGVLKLSAKSWDYVRNKSTKEDTYVDAINGCGAYRGVLEWAFHQKFESLNTVDISTHWNDNYQEDCGKSNENTLRDQAICFCKAAEAAGLGRLTVGRKGAQTRIDLDMHALSGFIQNIEPKKTAIVDLSLEDEGDDYVHESDVPQVAEAASTGGCSELPSGLESSPGKKDESVRVFISHGKNRGLLEQAEAILGLADIKSEVAVNEESSAIPVPDKIFGAMKKCNAGVIIVSVEEESKDLDGNYTVNKNVLVEIGAAFVLYDKRVVLLWDDRIEIPSNLQGLYRCTFQGDELSWAAGVKLMKAIKQFKDDIRN